MLKVGLTGGYATGKSFVASELKRSGCHIIYADELGHQVLEPSGEAYAPTLKAFGDAILKEDGTIDRKKLGAIVFGSPELLQLLTSFVHPAVFRLEQQVMEERARTDPFGIAVIEAAILIETGRYRMFDRVILTTCAEETQISRGMARDGLTAEQVRARLDKQLPLEEKKKFADYLINTDGNKESTALQVQAVYRELKQMAEAGRK